MIVLVVKEVSSECFEEAEAFLDLDELSESWFIIDTEDVIVKLEYLLLNPEFVGRSESFGRPHPEVH